MRLYCKKSVSRPITVLFHVTENIKKILSDHNTYIVSLFYRLHDYIVHIVIVTITDIVTVTVLSQ